MRHVVIPQAARIVLPPIGNQMIGMLKLSALVSVIAVEELLLVANQTASADFRYFEALTAAGIYYLAMTTAFMGAADPDRDARSIRKKRQRKRRFSLTERMLGSTGSRRSGEEREMDSRTMQRQGRTLLEIDRHQQEFRIGAGAEELQHDGCPKETVVVIGPSGSGKSTLLRCINLLEPVDSGEIFFEGENITGERKNGTPECVRQIGMVFQNFELFSHLSAAENIMLAPVKILGMSRADAHDIAVELLRKVHIPEKADAFPDELSGGQQQRVAIARALAMKPKLMLYDEPTSALDPEMIREVLDVMTELSSAEGMTSVVVTHEMGFARRAADRIVFMERGEIIESASSDQFFGGNGQRARPALPRPDPALNIVPGTRQMSISPDVGRMKRELAALVAIRHAKPSGPRGRAPRNSCAIFWRSKDSTSRCRSTSRDRINVVARLENGAGPVFAFNTHMDVVPVGEGWSSDPFALKEADGRLYGRGACDCKGPLAAMLEAMRMLAADRAAWSGTLLGVFVADEEIASEGAKFYASAASEDRCRGRRRADLQRDLYRA